MTKGKLVARAIQPAQVGSIQAGTPAPPLLDSTENLILRRHLVPLRTFQALIGWTSPRSVAKALGAHSIFAIDLKGQLYFPAFYADAIYSRRHLAAVKKQLGALPAGAKLQFFGSRKASLGGQTPLEALAAGRQLATVMQLAAAYAVL